MTNIIFSFDTEDFTDSHTADGILEMVRLLQEEGVRGCFCIVGYLARQLLAWGRTDVLDALRYHEVDFHTLGHTMHPTIGEYTDTEDYRTACNEVGRYSRVVYAYSDAAVKQSISQPR